MAKKKPPEEHENLERWLVSYGDFITLLFATFVVLYALSQIDLSEFTKLEDSIAKAFNGDLLEGSESVMDGKDSVLDANAGASSMIAPLMLEALSPKYEEQAMKDLQEEIEEMKENGDLQGVEVKLTDKGLIITFKDDLLFYSSSATLTDKAKKSLDNIGALISEKFALHYIRVEGHTDNQPVHSYLFPSNWELSGARSSSIIRYFIDRFKFMPNIFTSVGFADTRPLVDNNTNENRAKNRRVEIIILKNKFRKLEQASNLIMKQSKKAQEKFQAERMAAVERVRNGSPALQKLKANHQENTINLNENQTTNNFYAQPTNEKEKTMSIKNKTLYEQVQNEPEKQETNTQNQDDNFLNLNSKNILQNDINKQFDTIGQ